MNLAPMRYKDYVWPHNPETYTISFKRQVAVAKVPFGRYGMQDLGMSYRVMEGEGVFAGKGAYDEFKKLAPCLLRARPALGAQPLHRLLAVEHLVHKAIEVVRVRHLLRALFARQRAGISEHAPFQPFVGRVLHAFFSASTFSRPSSLDGFSAPSSSA